MDMKRKGTIWPVYHVYCGNDACDVEETITASDDILGRDDAIWSIQEEGWRRHHVFGWICPECVLEVEIEDYDE